MTPDALRQQIAELVARYAEAAHAPKLFVPGESVIPPSGKVIGARELQLMVEASLDGWLTTGRFNAEFEKKLAAFLGVKHLITVNSGSSANLVAFSTLTSPKLGDRAIRPGLAGSKVAEGLVKAARVLPNVDKYLLHGILSLVSISKHFSGYRPHQSAVFIQAILYGTAITVRDAF